MSDNPPIQAPTDEDSSPRHKHLRKLQAEAEALKKAKAKKKIIRSEYVVVYDTRGKPKYRKISYMENGNKHSEYVSVKDYEKLKAKEAKKSKKRQDEDEE